MSNNTPKKIRKSSGTLFHWPRVLLITPMFWPKNAQRRKFCLLSNFQPNRPPHRNLRGMVVASFTRCIKTILSVAECRAFHQNNSLARNYLDIIWEADLADCPRSMRNGSAIRSLVRSQHRSQVKSRFYLLPRPVPAQGKEAFPCQAPHFSSDALAKRRLENKNNDLTLNAVNERHHAWLKQSGL